MSEFMKRSEHWRKYILEQRVRDFRAMGHGGQSMTDEEILKRLKEIDEHLLS